MTLRTTKFRFSIFSIFLILISVSANSLVQAHDNTRLATKESFPGASNFKPQEAYKYSQAAIGKLLGNYKFVSTENKIVTLDQYRGKPLILSMVYSSCMHTCPMMTHNLAEAVQSARDALGSKEFNVISVGFDTLRDTPRAMKSFSRQQDVGDENWHVLSGKPNMIESLSADTGFIYFASPKGFDHLTQTTLIDADGRVYAQIYGQEFDPTRLTEPLKQLLLGTMKSLNSFDALVSQVKLFCTVYDPYAGKYRFDYSFFIGMFLSAIVLVLAGTFIVRNAWRIWREPSDTSSA